MAEINVEDLKPNSRKYKAEEASRPEERERLKPVVKKENVVSTKKPFGKKMADAFLSEDVKDVKDYVIKDLIIPGIMNAIIDTLRMAFFGERDRRDERRRYDDRPPYSYSSRYRYGSSNRSSRREDRRYESDDKVDYRHIVLDNRDDADRIVYELRDRIRDTGQATIGDLFDLVEVAGAYTDQHWGWKDERDIRVRRISSGYLIDVAEAVYVD